MAGTKCNLKYGKWEFDIWKWPKRIKKRGKESSELVEMKRCLVYVHQLAHLVIHWSIHQFVHLITFMDDIFCVSWLEETREQDMLEMGLQNLLAA